ncbi:hypothetical protein BDZ89DRAFT_1166711 [Hymenopellis radicata]|nr:hypothetical protein BDZ89DRAFT_1166711 [Hymenopellis radicata]
MQRYRMMTQHHMVPRRPDTVESIIAVRRTEQGLQYKVSYEHGLYAHRNWKAPSFFEPEANKKQPNKENQLSRFWSHISERYKINREDFVCARTTKTSLWCSNRFYREECARCTDKLDRAPHVFDRDDDSEVVEDPDQLKEELAIEFAKEQADDDLWEDLLQYSESRPAFIVNGLEIPGLKEGHIKILQDFQLQMSLLDGC